MKIGLDISQIVYDGTGVARFTSGLVNSILEYDTINDWLFFYSGLRRPLDKNLEQRIRDRGQQLVKWKVPPSLLSFFWNDLHKIPSLLPAPYSLPVKLDWFITSDWTEPNLNINKATVVHDLTYLRYPDTVHADIRRTQTARLKWVKKESGIIFADSEATKDDLVQLLQIDENKIVVNYPGVEVTKPPEATLKEVLKKYHLTKPFILTVGKLEPRKNLSRLIEAMKQGNNTAIDLVIVGPSGWDKQLNDRKIEQSNIKFLGLVPDSDLYSLYTSARFFIYPSIWEGFGYPVVEAMKLGTSVTCSNTSSVGEIAGEAALLFNPDNTEDITRCISTMIRDEPLRKRLVAKANTRSKIFSWKNYYNKFIQSLYDYRH